MVKKLILLPLLLLLFTVTVKAGYIAGADLQYKCLGGDSFQVILKVYADCRDSSLSSSAVVKVMLINCSGLSINVSLQQTGVKDITPLCSTSSTICNGGTVEGMKSFTYEGVINLSTFTNCCNFRISFEAADRHSDISTGLAGQNLYIEAMLNKCLSLINNSPVFDDLLHMYLKAGQVQNISFCAVDTLDHDSLVFSLEYALQGLGTFCSYYGTYGGYRPMMFLGYPNPIYFDLNSQTGLLKFWPTKLEYGVVVVKVSEYRNINGIPLLIGEITRDLMLMVRPNPNNKVPVMQSGDTAYKVCAGEEICFKTFATDYDTITGDSTELFFWNHGITHNVVFNRTGTKTDSATFCWEPGSKDARTRPYYFTITARDKGCPFNAYVSKVFSITVFHNLVIDALPSTIVKCKTAFFKPGVIVAPKKLSYSWQGAGGFSSTDSLPVFTYAADGTYPYSLLITSPHNCDSFFYQDTVVVNTLTKVSAGPDISVCKGSSIRLIATPMGGKPPFTYNWNNGLSTADSFTSILNSNQTYKVTMTDSNGCFHTDELVATVYTANVDAGPDISVCEGSNSIILSSGIPTGGQWSGIGVLSNTFNPSVSGIGSFRVFYRIMDIHGCNYLDSFLFTVNSLPFVNAGADQEVCILQSNISLTGIPAGGSWSGTGVTGKLFFPSAAGAGTYYLKYSYTDAKGCSNSDQVNMHVISQPPVAFTANLQSGNPPVLVTFTNQTLGPTDHWTWDFGDPGSGANNYSFQQNPQHYYNTAGSYTVTLLAENKKCPNSISKGNYINVFSTGIQDNLQRPLQLYPNPSAGDVTISFENVNAENFSLSIYDVPGKLIMNVTDIRENYLIKAETLPAGIYQVKLNGKNGTVYNATLIIE